MPDVLTPEERAAIDSHIKANGVNRIPRGESGLTKYTYQPGKGLVSTDEHEKKGWRGMNWGTRRKGPTPKVAARRVQVVEMLQSGMSYSEAAEALQVSVSVISTDARHMGYRRPGGRGTADEIEARRERLAAMAARGLSGPEIAIRLGIKAKRIYEEAAKIGVHVRHETPRRGTRIAEKTKREMAAIKELHEQGRTVPEMANETKIAKRRIRTLLGKLGLKAHPAPRGAAAMGAAQTSVERGLQTRRRVAEAYDPDKSAKEIAEAAGVSESTTLRHLRDLGLKSRRGPRRDPAIERRRETVKEMAADGYSGVEIAKALGVSRYVIYEDAKLLGVVFIHPQMRRAAE